MKFSGHVQKISMQGSVSLFFLLGLSSNFMTKMGRLSYVFHKIFFTFDKI